MGTSLARAQPRAAPGRKPRADGVAARARVLDSAEQLFAERGFFGTSIRDITGHAGVRLASVNYHFESKEELFRDVVLRRAHVLSEDRTALLGLALQRKGARGQRLHAVVSAFVEPLVRRGREDRGYRAYFALIAQVASSRLLALSLLAEHFNALAARFIAAFAALYPEATPSTLQYAYQFMLGATLYAFSDNRRLDSLTAGAQRSDDFAQMGEELICFVSAGIAAHCAREARKARRKRGR